MVKLGLGQRGMFLARYGFGGSRGEVQRADGSERYTLTAQDLLGSGVALNGTELKLGGGDALPKLVGKATAKGQVEFAPASITFLAIPGAENAGCK